MPLPASGWDVASKSTYRSCQLKKDEDEVLENKVIHVCLVLKKGWVCSPHFLSYYLDVYRREVDEKAAA
jgi:hypothetical protein